MIREPGDLPFALLTPVRAGRLGHRSLFSEAVGRTAASGALRCSGGVNGPDARTATAESWCMSA